MIRFDDVSKSFWSGGHQKVILHDASFRVDVGRNLGILAPNGTGKTTLINMMAGLEKPDHGSITRRGRISWPVGFNGGVVGYMSGAENIRYIARLYDRDEDETLAFCVDFAELDHYIDMPVRTYSSGMRQRLVFALLMAIDFDAEAEDVRDADLPDDAPPPLDEDAIAKHRAAKMARIRRRQEENRRIQEEAEGLRPDRAPVPTQPKPGPARRGSALPAIRPDVKPDTPALRAERVEAIRRDLVRRRRRKGAGLLLRLWLFVILPTMGVAWFLWYEASDLYRSESSFVVQAAEGPGSAGASGGFFGALLGGAGGIYDPVAVQTYILSRDVLHRLADEHGWIAHFRSPELDLLHRLQPEASFEDAYDHYQDMVSVSFDPTEGLIEMQVIAADPVAAQAFSRAIIGYSEQMVDDLSNRIRTDAIADAEQNLAEAEERLKAAQQGEAELRKTLETFSVEGEVSTEMGIIAGMETQLETLRGRLENLRAVTAESDPRIGRLRGQVETLEQQIEDRRDRVTGPGQPEAASLADISAELARAQLDVQAAMAIFTAALEAREMARANAARQHRYLAVVAAPSLPDEPNYPQKWQVTALAFLGFLGAYIIMSLTISLIREQASI